MPEIKEAEFDNSVDPDEMENDQQLHISSVLSLFSLWSLNSQYEIAWAKFFFF